MGVWEGEEMRAFLAIVISADDSQSQIIISSAPADKTGDNCIC